MILDRRGYSFSTVVLVVAVVGLSLLSGYMFLRLRGCDALQREYVSLYDSCVLLEDYYDNLTGMYSELRAEYDQLLGNNKELLRDYYNLTVEYDDVLNFRKEVLLVDGESVYLPIEANVSYSFELPFAGYIAMEFSADDDVYVWVGSSMLDDVYYYRYPMFPETAEVGSFVVPVAPDLRVFVGNPNEFNGVRVEFTINFVY